MAVGREQPWLWHRFQAFCTYNWFMGIKIKLDQQHYNLGTNILITRESHWNEWGSSGSAVIILRARGLQGVLCPGSELISMRLSPCKCSISLLQHCLDTLPWDDPACGATHIQGFLLTPSLSLLIPMDRPEKPPYNLVGCVLLSITKQEFIFLLKWLFNKRNKNQL